MIKLKASVKLYEASSLHTYMLSPEATKYGCAARMPRIAEQGKN